jgi:hypothetical protein
MVKGAKYNGHVTQFFLLTLFVILQKSCSVGENNPFISFLG